MTEDQYWASDPDPEAFGTELIRRKNEYFRHMEASGIADRIRRSYQEYYSTDESGRYRTPGVERVGEAGELLQLGANHFRSLVQHILVLTTGQRPAYEPHALNLDAESLDQVLIAGSVLEHYMRDRKLESKYRQTAEVALLAGRGFLHLGWDYALGQDVETPTELSVDPTGQADPQTAQTQLVRSGDVRAEVLTPFEVVKDPFVAWDDAQWCVAVTMRNRWDLMAQFPAYRAQIEAAKIPQDVWRYQRISQAGDQRTLRQDNVFVYTFYHESTPSLPDGRMALVIEDGTMLWQGALPYARKPVLSMTAGEVVGSSDGYTSTWDLLGLQEMAQAVLSAASTNFDAFGVSNVIVEDGCDISPMDLVGGMQMLRVPRGTTILPQGMQLTRMPDGYDKLYEMLVREMQTTIGINDVTRGNPDPSLKSGAALAMMHSVAVQFQSGFQGSYIRLLEDGGQMILELNQKFAEYSQIVYIVGQDKQPMARAWNRNTLSRINRVTVDIGNPLTRTLAGRIQMSEWYLDMRKQGIPGEDFDRLVEIVTTGKLEPLTERSNKENSLVRRENEALRRGPPIQLKPPPMPGAPPQKTVPTVPAVFSDKHRIHLEEHFGILTEEEMRMNPAVVQAVLAHCQEHLDLLRFTDPAILMANGQEPLPPIMPDGTTPPTAGPAGQPTDKVRDTGSTPGDGAAPPPGSTGTEPSGARMPKMPKNPSTGKPETMSPGPGQ